MHKGHARGLRGQRARRPPAERSDHVSTPVNKLAAVTVTDTGNDVPLSIDSTVELHNIDLQYMWFSFVLLHHWIPTIERLH